MWGLLTDIDSLYLSDLVCHTGYKTTGRNVSEEVKHQNGTLEADSPDVKRCRCSLDSDSGTNF